MFGKTKTDNVAKGFLEGYKESGWEAMGPADEYQRRELVALDFEKDEPMIAGEREDSIVHHGSYSCRLNHTNKSFLIWDQKVLEFTNTQESWVRVTFWLYSSYLFKYNPGYFMITMNHQGTKYKYRSLVFQEEGWIPLKWNKVIYTYRIPYIEDPDDRLMVYLWKDSPENLYIEDVTVELYEPNDE